jgi:hypothetical protein
MSWREIEYQVLKNFCKEWKSKQDFMNEYSFSESEARHCFNYLKKLSKEFLFREKMNDKKRRSHEIKSINNENV